MNRKITYLTMIVFIFLLVFTACTQIDPLGIANGIPEGYVPGAVFDNNWIYYVEEDRVKRIRPDGTEPESVFTLPSVNTAKILLDPVRQKMYIFNHFAAITNSIYQYNLDGTGETLVADESTSDIYGIAIDHINGYLYYIMGNGIKSVNLDDLTSTTVLTWAISTSSSVIPDYNGTTYYFDAALVYRVDTPASATTLAVTPAISVNSLSPVSNLAGDTIYYYDTNLIYTIDMGSFVSQLLVDPAGIVAGNMVLYEKGGKILFYDDNGGAGKYIIYSINMDGTGSKSVVLDNGFTLINSFDILDK